MTKIGWQIYKISRTVKSLKTKVQREIYRFYPSFFLDEETRRFKEQLPKPEFTLLISPWYHDFTGLGFHTRQRRGMYKPAQECKQQPLFDLIDHAISLCREKGKPASGIELFCADGFYSNYAVRRGAAMIHGTDRDAYDLSKARLITRILGNQGKITFEQCDVFDIPDTYDFAICAGGLYHISNPGELLKLLRGKTRTACVIQTIYSLSNISEDYFESRSSRGLGGFRFSYSYLLKMVGDAGWKILEARTNEMKCHKHLEDRGSAYLLCVPDQTRNHNDAGVEREAKL